MMKIVLIIGLLGLQLGCGKSTPPPGTRTLDANGNSCFLSSYLSLQQQTWAQFSQTPNQCFCQQMDNYFSGNPIVASSRVTNSPGTYSQFAQYDCIYQCALGGASLGTQTPCPSVDNNGNCFWACGNFAKNNYWECPCNCDSDCNLDGRSPKPHCVAVIGGVKFCSSSSSQ